MIKTIATTLLFMFSFLNFNPVNAQDDKAIKKEWKKKMKEMDPIQFKALVEERDKLKTEQVLSQAKVAELQNELKMKSIDNDSLKAQVSQQQKEIQDLKSIATAQMAASSPEKAGKKGSDIVVERKSVSELGVTFKVQVGNFRNKDLSKYFENNPNFSGEIDPDGSKKYTLGLFKDYWEADNFKKYLREMGVNDAWIVSYKDGKRVPIKEVLEGTLQTP